MEPSPVSIKDDGLLLGSAGTIGGALGNGKSRMSLGSVGADLLATDGREERKSGKSSSGIHCEGAMDAVQGDEARRRSLWKRRPFISIILLKQRLALARSVRPVNES